MDKANGFENIVLCLGTFNMTIFDCLGKKFGIMAQKAYGQKTDSLDQL